MSADDATEWAEVLKQVTGEPPLKADFVFDLPPSDERKGDRVGALMYQALLLKQDHPELSFDNIRAVTFTMDVHRTGEEIEKVVGHDLPAYRNAAARMDVFALSLGPGQLLIVTDDLAQAALSPSLPTCLTAWERLRTELMRSVAVLKLKTMPAQGPATRRFEQLVRYTWTEYFCGWYASVEGLDTNLSRSRLRVSLEEDPASLSRGLDGFRRNHDLADWVSRAEGDVRGIFESMAEVIGQLRARELSLADLDGPLDSLLHAQGLSPIFDALSDTLNDIGAEPSAPALTGIATLAQTFLGHYGLAYEEDGSIISAPSAL